MTRGILFVVGLLAALPATRAEDWPRWRGPRGDGTWNAPALPDKWPAGGPRVVWRKPIGGGYAGVTVADSRVFTMDYEPAADQKSGTERVLCLDAATGEPVWSHRYAVTYGDLGGYANGPRAAPFFDDGKLYTLGTLGHLFCFDAAKGTIVWRKDTVKECGARVPMWGFAAAPVIDGPRLIVHLGAEPKGCYVAFDRATGKEVWRALSDEAGYCTPVVADTPSGRQLIAWTPEHVHGLDSETGKPFWKVPYKVTYGVSIATPIVREGLVFVTGYWEGSKAIRLGTKPTDAELAWQDGRALRGLMAQPLYRDGYVYTFDKQHGMTCFELKTGKKLWDDDNTLTPAGRNPHASVVWLNGTDRILALNSAGELVLARLSPKGYEEQTRAKVLSGRVWSHPAFAGRFMYAHTDGAEAWRKSGPHELVCVELAPAK
jgi:outer membrane protein assembly factor BamB